MSRYIYILLIVLAAAQGITAEAQSRIRARARMPQVPDSLDLSHYTHPDLKQAALTIVGLNLGVWAFDRYVQGSDYARVTARSLHRNLTQGFKWDNDRMSNNMFLHPYHGNLYFNAARSNGFNYWQSGLFAFAGSAMWELFCENEYPSTNDIIVTPIGGMAIGEVAYRTSDLVLDDRARGWSRVGHEVAGFLISPMRGITRIINGDAWRHSATTGRVFGKPKLDVEISAGIRSLGFKRHFITDRTLGFNTEVNIEYGDPFELRNKAPYDYFTMKLSLSAQRSQPILDQLNIMGRLISRELIDTRHHDLSIGMYQHYDFYDSDTISRRTDKTPYNLAVPASVGLGVIYRGFDQGKYQIDAHAHFNAVIMGGVLTDHYNMDDRNYNLGSGFSIKTGVNMVYGHDKFSLSATYDYFRMFTWGYPRDLNLAAANPKTINSLGDDSVAYFGITDVRADLRVYRQLYVTLCVSHYMRVSRYRDFPNVHSSSFANRLMLTYKF